VKVARQFAFLENTWSWKQYVSLYNSLQADAARTSPLVNGGSNPRHLAELLIDSLPAHQANRFRREPQLFPLAADIRSALAGNGFAGSIPLPGIQRRRKVRAAETHRPIRQPRESNTTTDKKSSLNQAYGVSFGRLWNTGLLLDLHYSNQQLFWQRKIRIVFPLEESHRQFPSPAYGGHQVFNTTLSTNTNSNFVNGVVDLNVGPRYFLEGNYGWYHGTSLNYTQWSSVFGYRIGGFRK